MKVSEVMTAQVVTAQPSTSVREAARTMAEIDSGALPIVDGGNVVGLVTDRDIVLRVVAKGGSLDGPISEVMSGDVQTCDEEDNLADATAQMANHSVRRLVVVNGSGRLTGMLSLGDVAVDYGAKKVGQTLEEISSAPPDH